MEGSLDRLPSGPARRVLGPRLISDAANDSLESFEGIIGKSLPLKNVMEQVRTVAPTDSTVLIQGETGTGKELIARAIHSQSARRDRKFVRLNCAAIPSDLLENELFGHERGAFTGAIARSVGRFELADNGTLFLDEIGDIPLELQSKLLRVLQEQEFERLGSTYTQRVNVRLVAATNRDLTQMVSEKEFRMDLYFRLNVFPIGIPPLRERREDIPELIDALFKRAKDRHHLPNARLSPGVLQRLMSYRWPGNVRQLENVLERLLVLSSSDLISEEDLPEELQRASTNSGSLWPELPEEGVSLEGIERELITRALERVRGNQTQAARYIDISRRTLIYRMEKHGLLADPFPGPI